MIATKEKTTHNTMTTTLTVDELKNELNTQKVKALNNYFNWDNEKTLKFLSAVTHCASVTPKLLECSQDSIITAFMKCAEYNLFPSTVSGEVYILPYYNKGKMEAQFQLGYKGIIALLDRAGIKVYTDVVKEKDTCEITSGMDQNILHKYPLTARWQAIGVYAIAIDKNGEKIMKYMSKDEVLEFKKFSKGKIEEYSPWNQKNDPELNMWRKTVIKQISKNLSLSAEIYEAIAKDNEESSIEDYHKTSMLEQSKRPTEMTIENLLPTNTTKVWPEIQTTLTESSETSNSATSPNELKIGSKPEQVELPAQDSQA